MKSININQDIEPVFFEEFKNNLEKLNLQSGETLRIDYDSVGGAIDIAKKIAKIIQDLKSKGVIVESVADGKVYSSAIIPFLCGDKKFANLAKNPKFLIHKVKMVMEDGVDLMNVDRIKSDLEKYTEELELIYRALGISEKAIERLASGGDLIVSETEEMKKLGLIDEVIEEKLVNSNFRAVMNWAKNQFEDPKKEAKFTYLNKFEESVDLTKLNKNQVEMENLEGFMNEMKSTLLNAIKEEITPLNEKLNDMDARVRRMETHQNKTHKNTPVYDEEITEEEWNKARNQFRKTSVMNHGKVKNVIHFAGKCKNGDWMLPVDEEYKFEEFEEECLNLSNGERFVKKKEVEEKIEPENNGQDITALINKATSHAPDTRVQNKGTGAVNTFMAGVYDTFKGLGKYSTGKPVMNKDFYSQNK